MIEPLYHQVIAGKKTQTRRSGGLEQVNGSPEVKKKGVVVKPAIISNPDDWEKAAWGGWEGHLVEQGFMKKGGGIISYCTPKIYCKPRYKIGEVLYLKEPIFIRYDRLYTDHTEILYKFDNKNPEVSKWSNKLFMAKEYARSFIRITSIKCERLLDISNEDCISEGIESADDFYKSFGAKFKNYLSEPDFVTPKASFISLFKFANKIKAKTELSNIWVFCYTFEYLPNYKIS